MKNLLTPQQMMLLRKLLIGYVLRLYISDNISNQIGIQIQSKTVAEQKYFFILHVYGPLIMMLHYNTIQPA